MVTYRTNGNPVDGQELRLPPHTATLFPSAISDSRANRAEATGTVAGQIGAGRHDTVLEPGRHVGEHAEPQPVGDDHRAACRDRRPGANEANREN